MSDAFEVRLDPNEDRRVVAEQIHAILRSLGANAFVITELKEDTEVRSITVTPLTCAER